MDIRRRIASGWDHSARMVEKLRKQILHPERGLMGQLQRLEETSEHEGGQPAVDRLEINRLFYAEKYGDLWKVICREDRISTICGAFYVLYLRNIHRVLLIDAGFVRHDREIREVFKAFRDDLGVGLEGVIAVLCTHLHADHLGNPELFPRATYYAHQEAIDQLQKRPEEVLYKDFQYQNGDHTLTMRDEVLDLTKIVERNGKKRDGWMQPLGQCPYAGEGRLIDLVTHHQGIMWGKTPGHAAGHCAFVLHLPERKNPAGGSHLSRWRHIILGDCLSQDQSPDARRINPGRRWIRSLGLKQLRKGYLVHPSHSRVAL